MAKERKGMKNAYYAIVMEHMKDGESEGLEGKKQEINFGEEKTISLTRKRRENS